MFTKMTLAGLERMVPYSHVEKFRLYGWKESGANPTVAVEQVIEPAIVESGAVSLKAPKKKKTEKSAEQVPEAAIEDLDNDITQGE